MKILILILSIVVLCCEAAAEERPCTKAEAIEAESSASLLNCWSDIYKSFERFRHCDDGAIAEGYSESVVRMLAFHWDQLEELSKLSSLDRDFFTFVIRHIDATADKSEIEKVIVNSSTQCPESASAMCSAIEETAKKVLRELQ